MGQGFCGNDGQYLCTGASRSSCPRSHSWTAATAVRDLEMAPRRKRVCSVAGAPSSRSALPNPPAHASLPLSTTATATPGVALAAMNESTAALIRSLLAGWKGIAAAGAGAAEGGATGAQGHGAGARDAGCAQATIIATETPRMVSAEPPLMLAIIARPTLIGCRDAP